VPQRALFSLILRTSVGAVPFKFSRGCIQTEANNLNGVKNFTSLNKDIIYIILCKLGHNLNVTYLFHSHIFVRNALSKNALLNLEIFDLS